MERIILHIDMNSYFASVEQQANPFLRGKAIGVTGKRFDLNRSTEAQRSIVATASRQAKACGVQTGMSTSQAMRLLPSLILVPADPEKYAFVTKQFIEILHEFTHRVEQASVDECYVDLTNEAKDYFGATLIAQRIRERIKEVCGAYITASIGIGPNKLIAKLASESEKPNGLVCIQPKDVLPFMHTLHLKDIPGIGHRTEEHLNQLGITTIQHLQTYPLQFLIDEFKTKAGQWLHNAAWGKHESPVTCTDEDPKSMSHSHTLPNDVEDPTEIKRLLLALCDKVAWRLRRDGFVAKNVGVYLRFHTLDGAGWQQRIQEPTADGLILYRTAWELIHAHWDSTPVRLVGISASMLSAGEEQPSLFVPERKALLARKALDKIQERFGDHSWTRASLLGVTFRPRVSGWHYDEG